MNAIIVVRYIHTKKAIYITMQVIFEDGQIFDMANHNISPKDMPIIAKKIAEEEGLPFKEEHIFDDTFVPGPNHTIKMS